MGIDKLNMKNILRPIEEEKLKHFIQLFDSAEQVF
jgi:hypothetical protein